MHGFGDGDEVGWRRKQKKGNPTKADQTVIDVKAKLVSCLLQKSNIELPTCSYVSGVRIDQFVLYNPLTIPSGFDVYFVGYRRDQFS